MFANLDCVFTQEHNGAVAESYPEHAWPQISNPKIMITTELVLNASNTRLSGKQKP